MPILLDTCALIFMTEDRLSTEGEQALTAAFADNRPTFVCPVSAWEIGLLVARGRLRMASDPAVWFRRVLELPGLGLSRLPSDALIASSFLPGDPPRDPADRLVIAAARALGAAVMTRDKVILAYGREGHVATIGC